MKKILEQLKEWRENIQCDLRADWPTDQEKSTMMLQLVLLCNAISNLENIGPNNNIPL